MNEAKLLACPFCGKEAEIERPGTARASMIIACTNCGGRMESGDVVGLTPPEQYAWNVRATIGVRSGTLLAGEFEIYKYENDNPRRAQCSARRRK